MGGSTSPSPRPARRRRSRRPRAPRRAPPLVAHSQRVGRPPVLLRPRRSLRWQRRARQRPPPTAKGSANPGSRAAPQPAPRPQEPQPSSRAQRERRPEAPLLLLLPEEPLVAGPLQCPRAEPALPPVPAAPRLPSCQGRPLGGACPESPAPRRRRPPRLRPLHPLGLPPRAAGFRRLRGPSAHSRGAQSGSRPGLRSAPRPASGCSGRS